jgi:hypothetical protein
MSVLDEMREEYRRRVLEVYVSKMPLFDFYIMVDWSGAASRRAGRSDTIWIAHGPRTADVAVTRSPHSRTEAIDLIHSVLEKEISLKRRVLICFDLPTAILSILQQPCRRQLETRSATYLGS